MKKLLVTVFALSWHLMGCAQTSTIEKDSYTVRIDRSNIRLISISANIQLDNAQLSMNWPSGNSVEKGWSHFVEDLEIFDSKNKPVKFDYVDTATWNLQTKDKWVRINYKVRADHDKVLWKEGGHSAASYVLEDLVYSIGAALFISSPTDVFASRRPRPTSIKFHLPEGYDIAIPWEKDSGSDHTYQVESTHDLVRTGMMIGKFPKHVQNVSNAEIEIATAEDFQAVVPMFQSIYEGIIPVALKYFGDETIGKYVVIANQAPRTEEFGPYFSGEALNQSMSLISPIVPTQEYLPMFWYMLTHEYLHMWIGHSIQADHQTGTWMMEGFTDYVSLKLLHEMGVFPNDVLINGVEMAGNSTGWGENIKKYLANAGKISMHDAGVQKQDNYDLVYSGGSTFALILDIEMNHVTDGKVGLDKLMPTLNQKFGLRKGGRPIETADVKRMVAELCGQNLDHLFDNYVLGTKVIPVNEYLAKAGLKVDQLGKPEQKISMNPNATAEQKMVLKAISGISF